MRLACWIVLLAALSQGQSPPSFEVASIRLQPWTNQGQVEVYVRGYTLYGEHVDLYRLVDFAYDLSPENYQISGGPAWAKHGILSKSSGAESTLYYVEAKAPVTGPPPTTGQFRLMLQALLADRFHLRVHHAQKDLPAFRLVIARDGPKLKQSAPSAEPVLRFSEGESFRIHAVHQPLKTLVDNLGGPNNGTGRPVIDQTGLTGLYDFDIEWSRNDLDPASETSSGPSMFTAVQKLGLKLEPTKAPTDTIVIDHAEKPSAN